MVRQSGPGLDQGPKPPAGLYHAVKSQEFDRRWREEQRSAKAQRPEGKRVYADFVRNARRGMRR